MIEREGLISSHAVVVIAAGCLGLLFGSFANVVIYRVPRRESVVTPRSRCPACGHEITWFENIPVLSWLALRRKCRSCSVSISARYPFVEFLTGALFALAALRLPGRDLLLYLPLLWVLVVLSFIDIDHKLLPNRIVMPATVAGVALAGAAAALGPGASTWLRAIEAGAASFAFFLALALIAPKGMGMGDVKLSVLLGLSLGYLGWGRVFVGFLLSFVAGALGGVLLIAVRRGGMKSQVPFGPYLAFGTTVSILWGAPIVNAWLHRN